MKIGKAYLFSDYTISPNYGGWILQEDFGLGDYNIYKTFRDAQNAHKKRKDGTNTAEPRIIGKMTDDQFINSLNM